MHEGQPRVNVGLSVTGAVCDGAVDWQQDGPASECGACTFMHEASTASQVCCGAGCIRVPGVATHHSWRWGRYRTAGAARRASTTACTSASSGDLHNASVSVSR